MDYSKFILDFTDTELKEELESILGEIVALPESLPKNEWGIITNRPENLYHGGNLDVDALNTAYNNELTKKYFITLSWTSMRRRPADLLNYIRNITPCNVLDYGSGSGTHSIACAQKGCEVSAFDISGKMLSLMWKRVEKRGIDISLMIVQVIVPIDRLPDDFYDFVICADVIEHVPDPVELLKHFIRKMKLGGVIHLHVSKQINLRKGHLPEAIYAWFGEGIKLLSAHFEKISEHNYKLVKK
jgi:ubiquinone/menaquinone biosynthesis C-methylase UbiE